MADPDILSQSEIDNLLNSLTTGIGSGGGVNVPPPQESASFQNVTYVQEVSFEEDKKGYKLYNFRRPDKFSKDHLRALQDVHREFSRQLALILSTYLRLHVDIDVVSVDQLTYDEFTKSMPSPITIGIVELNPLPGQVLIGMSHEVTSSIVDRMLGGVGASEAKGRELTDIEEALAKRIIEKITKTLEESWRSVFPVQGIVVAMDNNYSFIQVASPGEIVALITLEIQVSSRYSGLLSLCFPYPVLETVIGQLRSQHIFQTKGIISSGEDSQKILDKLNLSSVKINVTLGETYISVQDLIDLKEGDVLRLNNSVNDELVIKVNNIPKFLGRPGTKKNNVALSITDTVTHTNTGSNSEDE